jgi:hypothetical protein
MKQLHRLHVIKIPTSNKDVFPYSHYADEGHDPKLYIESKEDEIRLVCEDLFKLKPNVQKSPRTRVDIYAPGDAALELATEIIKIFGEGQVAERSEVNPNDYRRGPQTLPLIDESRRIQHNRTIFEIAGITVESNKGAVYIDRERPNEGHIEMRGPEIHIGIPLNSVKGNLNTELISRVQVPSSELRVNGEVNPINKARGRLRIYFSAIQATLLAATIIHYSKA